MIDERVQQAIAYLCHTDWTRSRLGLERMQELLNLLGNPQNKLKVVHVAGTNGKGSTCAFISSILQAAGYSVGMYTSPYIQRFNERIQINGEQISDDMLLELTDYIRPFADSMEDHPTEFELITVLAFEYYARMNCDVVVLEVGMGGRLDATNVIGTPMISVIANIGLDHTRELGDTVEKIAYEKAGIIKEGGTTVLYRQQKSVEEVIRQACEERHNELILPDFEAITETSATLRQQTFDYLNYSGLTLQLLGAHQQKNAAVALTVAEALRKKGFDISEEAIRMGLSRTAWPARFEVLSEDPLFILDGGHNPQCIQSIVENIKATLPGQKVLFLTGVLKDKDYAQMYDLIAPYAAGFVCVTPGSPRALEGKELAVFLKDRYGLPTSWHESVPEGVQEVIRKAQGKPVIAFGSLYMSGEIRLALGREG